MNTWRDFFQIFIWNSKIKLARSMEFRADFITGIITTIILACGSLIFQYFLYTNTKGFPGWTYDQILLFQSLFLLVTGLRNSLFGDVKQVIDNCVFQGQFDRLLLLPAKPLVNIFSSGFNYTNVGTVFIGVAALIFSFFSARTREKRLRAEVN